MLRTYIWVVLSSLAMVACAGGGGGGGPKPFRVVSVQPADGGMDVSVNGTVVITFSKEVTTGTVVNGSTFTLAESASPGVPIAGTISFDAAMKVMTFTPAAALAFGTDHQVSVTAGILDAKGKALNLAKGKVTFPTTFTTQSTPDLTAPVFAGAQGAMALTDTSIQVQWAAATDNVDPPSAIVYNLYASLTSGGQTFGVPDATTGPGATMFSLTGLTPATTYHVVVRAMDTSGNEDGNVVEVSATTLSGGDVTPPVFAGLVSATVLSPTEVTLSWAAATDDVATPAQIVYNIYQATSSGTQSFSTPDATTPPGTTMFVASGLVPDLEYFFVVRAEDPSGNEEMNVVEQFDRTLVSFGTIVGPIFSGCTCHSGPSPTQGMNLSSYPDILATAIDVPANQTSGTTMLDRIEPLLSGSSYLVNKIEGTQVAAGGSGGRMPAAGCCLDPLTEMDPIKRWIDQGALDN